VFPPGGTDTSGLTTVQPQDIVDRGKILTGEHLGQIILPTESLKDADKTGQGDLPVLFKGPIGRQMDACPFG
jgi:hypothetical protein